MISGMAGVVHKTCPMYRHLSLVLIPGLVQPVSAIHPVHLENALREGTVSMRVEGTGGHSGEVLRTDLKNRTRATMEVLLPAGWVFQSMKEEVQDLLVVRAERVRLAPGATVPVTCRVFCTQGRLRSPEVGERYRPGGMGKPELVQLARKVAEGTYPDAVVQAGVWTVANGHSIAGMGAMDSSAIDTLRNVVSRLSGQPPPRYTMHFLEEPGRACSGRPALIERVFTLENAVPIVFHAVVLDPAGRVMQVLHQGTLIPAGRHSEVFSVPVADKPPGRYAIHVWTQSTPGVHRLPFTL